MESAVAGSPALRLVVLEIGCGERVPSVRGACDVSSRDLS